MAEIIWTREAENWLKDIHDYISLDDSEAAVKVIDGIYEKVQSLKQLPESGYSFSSDKDTNIRILLYGHYRIAYMISPDESIIILGVFHGALDITRYLSE